MEVKKNSIIITGWRYVNVFDINQTEGDELQFGHSDKVTGDISFDQLKLLSPLPVIVEYSGTSNGNITLRKNIGSSKG